MRYDPELFRGGSKPERRTSARYSLAYGPISTEDYYIEHVAGNIRILRYPNPGKYRTQLRKNLMSSGLMMGSPLSDESTDELVFRIPDSARPLAYDSSSTHEGAFSYDDRKLFSDLGLLFGKLTRIDPVRPNVLRGEIGRALAIVEFTRPDQERLQMVPGTELLVFPTNNLNDASAYYHETLAQEFDGRFDDSVDEFDAAFQIGNQSLTGA